MKKPLQRTLLLCCSALLIIMLVGRTAFSMSSRLQTPAALRESELPAYIEDTSESVGAIPTPLVGYPMRSPEPEETANDTSGVTLEHPLPKASIRPYKTLPPMPIATVEDALVEQSSLFQHASQEKRPHTLLGFARSLDTLLLAGFSLLSLALGLALVSRSLRAHREEKQDKESQKGAQPNSGDPQEAEPISKWTINAAVCNHKGNIRHNNEDNFYLNGRFMVLGEMDDGCLAETVSDATLQTYSVCDGMGGEAAGEEASCYAVKALDSLMHESGDSLSNDQICKATNQISKDIYQGAKSKGCRSGATLAMCIWQGESMRVAHIGDSRVYMLRGGTLRQLTSDHSEAQRMINLGIITPQEALTHPKRHVINQYLGMPADEVTVVPTITEPIVGRDGDRYLLCSDGLTDMVDNAGIQALLGAGDTPKQVVQELVQQALANGGRDNVTALCLFLHEQGRPRRLSVARRVMIAVGFALCLCGLALLAELIVRLI